MEFLNVAHEDRFFTAMHKARKNSSDYERAAFFYIMTGNEQLYTNFNKIYDFTNNQIIGAEVAKLGYLSSGIGRLMHLGLHLYNDVNELQGTIVDMLCGLDESNFKLAINAMCIRAGRQ